jgi:hypothetical protein
MLKKLFIFVIVSFSAHAMEKPIGHKHEEPTLTFTPSIQAILEKASFEKENSFTVGDFALIKNILATYNLKTSADAKIVQIIGKNRNEYTFLLVKRKDENGTPIIYSEVSIKDPELLGKVPQEIIPETLKN